MVGPFLTTKAFLPQLRLSKNAVITNISSNAGSISDNDSGGNLSYRVAKAALNMVSVDTARELAPEGIACIALHPGGVKTKMSGFTGHMGPDEAVTRMLKVLDGIDMSKTGRFFHRDGQELAW
ncbi:related to C-factor [Rhynchosporium agropyri]|uniref:Related to C-factor n=1 Tax=Rhynchosporium agropyri TaxID=914238 RepID=A0A1E1KQN5_9HELO|nr:related to C-factor [Rhynchosporium agropyri]